MAEKLTPTWNWFHEPDVLFLSHVRLKRADLSKLSKVGMLTCWGVKFEDPAMLLELPNLWWFDWRGGRHPSLDWIGELRQLRFLQILHAYGVESLDFLASLTKLQGLMLYALPKVRTLPNMEGLVELKTVDLGSMKSLIDIGGLAKASALTSLGLGDKVTLSPLLAEQFRGHPSLSSFGWHGERAPVHAQAVTDALGLTRYRTIPREEWPFDNLTESQEATLQMCRDDIARRRKYR